jgi:hypothetical protein
MSTHVSVNTYAYSTTHVTGELLRSIKDIIRWSGLSIDKLTGSWNSLELAVSTWLSTKSLQKVTLEVFQPTTGELMVRWDFDIDYTYSLGDDGSLWADPEAIKNAIVKCGAIPATCKYEFKILAPGGASVSGWSSSSYRSTSDFNQHSIGTTVGAYNLGSSTSYWRKAS